MSAYDIVLILGGFLLFVIFIWLMPSPKKSSKKISENPYYKPSPFEFLKNAEFQGRPKSVVEHPEIYEEEYERGRAYEAGRLAAKEEAERRKRKSVPEST